MPCGLAASRRRSVISPTSCASELTVFVNGAPASPKRVPKARLSSCRTSSANRRHAVPRRMPSYLRHAREIEFVFEVRIAAHLSSPRFRPRSRNRVVPATSVGFLRRRASSWRAGREVGNGDEDLPYEVVRFRGSICARPGGGTGDPEGRRRREQLRRRRAFLLRCSWAGSARVRRRPGRP